MDYTKQIDCAAIRTTDGRVWTGKRHHHVLATIIQATGGKFKDGIQGFITMVRCDKYPQGRFVTREEAHKLCEETGQVTEFVHKSQLFSEDLY